MGRVYGYVRVSTPEQAGDDRTSLETQRRRIQGLAMAADLGDVEFFEDAGVSGSVPLRGRPAGGAMWDRLERGDCLVAAKLDRLFRSASDALATADELARRGVSLYLLDMGTEPVTGTGTAKLFFGMLALMADFEKTLILERLSDGRRGKRDKGGHVGGASPYGYRVVGSGREARLEPVEAEQKAIALMRECAAEGMSLRRIAAALAEAGHEAPSHVTIRRILRGAEAGAG